ncbi:unnamed protein product [Eruca vesicaria subsp. sativa]|uniref:Uncharacterized protein n=1 Tax=Eruca vesicaria subsp. sativa TaxID=29727 RepID=A0ABC8M362_ERUVS|nr:unnamed protein product [Eruca vesicaria subsp. sativa]
MVIEKLRNEIIGDDEMIGDLMKNNNGDVVDNNNNRLSRWHHNSSRIIRVSRASGGKDRHSKVWTSKGPRDRRVRLSVSTALQFYDLQDRLGYDQPSKAVEWLIKAAEDSISELPSLNNTNFPMNDDDENQIQTVTGASAPAANSLSKSACSSNSDTSKNSSGLSLSRSELRDKARERARERTAKETKERDGNNNNNNNHHTTSFTDLLNSGSDPVNANRQWMAPSSSPAPMEYFSSGLILGSGQTHYPIQTNSHPFSSISDHQHHPHPHQEFSFVPDHLISPGESNGGGAFNLDFNMSTTSVASTGFSGFSRGTLQSNSSNHHQQSFLANLQRFPSSEGGGGPQFLFGNGALPAENHHPHHNNHNHQFQLYYENGCRNSDQKGKGKN